MASQYAARLGVLLSLNTAEFSKNVDDAIAQYKKLGADTTTQGLLTLIGGTDRIIHRFQVEHGIAAGFDEKGEELLNVPLTEPIIERNSYDENIHAIRNNTP